MDDVPELKDRGSENGAPQRAPFFTYTEKNKTVSRGNSAADRADLDCGEVFSVRRRNLFLEEANDFCGRMRQLSGRKSKKRRHSMKKKWMQKAVAAALMASLLAGQALPAAAADAARVDTETLKIATLSDTHYLSPDMIKNTEDFTEHLNSDRKMFAESDAFLRALLDTVKQDDPDVLLISGDLTKDGEKEGHEALANILETDAGMDYIFTGHMHANDIAAVTTEAGNTLYDIETGSVVTYPSPARSVTLTRTVSEGKVSETMDVKTYTNVGPVTFTSPVTGQEQTIEDISAYGREHGFSNDMLTTTVNGFLHPYYEQIIQEGGSKAAIESLINSLLGDSLPVENVTLEQLIDIALPLLLPGADSGEEIYYDSAEGGICVNKKVSFLTLSLVVPNEGLKDTLNALLDKLDNEALANPEVMDSVIESLVVSLTTLPVSQDGDTEKTLLDYANYIYQSHLGGEDSGEQPAWVTEATANIENGELLGALLTTVIQDVTSLAEQILGNVSLEELLGASGWDNTNKELTAIDGRTPLLRPTESGKTVFSAALVLLGWSDTNDDGILEIPEGANPEVGYSVQEFLDKLGNFGMDLDIMGLLNNLLIGTPEEPGIIDEELKGEINSWLLNLVISMGTDSNYPEDNNTTITAEWKLLTDRTALDAAIALRLAASQEEMDAAAQELNDAVAALEKKADSQKPDDTQNPDGSQNAGDTQDPGTAQTPGDDEKPGSGNGNQQAGGSQTTVKVSKTGDASVILPFVILAIAGGGAAVIVLVNRKREYNHHPTAGSR